MTYDSAVSLFNEITIGHRLPCSLRMEVDGIFVFTISLTFMDFEKFKNVVKVIDFRELQCVSLADGTLEVY